MPHIGTTILMLALACMAAGCAKGPEEKAQPRSAEVSVITVEARDVELLTKWIDWAFAETKAALAKAA